MTTRPAGEPDPDGPPLWGRPVARGGKGCASLGELRGEIDRIDRALVDLLAERAAFTREAARFKATIDEVAAPQRAAAVIEGATRRAVAEGVPERIARAVFEALVRSSIDDQRAYYLDHRGGSR
ncbi:MAG: chorismate mutase [Azospirillaceae bacterium]